MILRKTGGRLFDSLHRRLIRTERFLTLIRVLCKRFYGRRGGVPEEKVTLHLNYVISAVL